MSLAPRTSKAKNIDTTGKRKNAIARVILKAGKGDISVNGREFQNYFGREALRFIVNQPLEVTATQGRYDISANIFGGGPAGQAAALKHAIAKALLETNPELRKALRGAGLLTRDSREVERKKYGRRGARRRSQYSKR
ncbi:MAG: 30S ribosomal protein S9 [Deltaproteobacteria bacterium]|nr:MAG: 30S ribosomal protein S9 [Deltaproteobacteria bacterium]